MSSHELLVWSSNEKALGGAGTPEASSVNAALMYLSSLHSPVSRHTMGSKLNVFAQWAGFASLRTCAWGQMRPEHIAAFMSHLEALGRKGSTVNCYLAALKGVAKSAWMLSQMNHEAYLRIDAIKQRRYYHLPTGRAITRHESFKLLDICDEKTIQGCRNKLIFALMLGCGLRRSEVTLIRWADVYRQEKSIRILGKGDKERMVYLSPDVARILDLWIEMYRGEAPGYLIGRLYKNQRMNLAIPLDPSTVGRLTREYMLKANQTEASAHDLRRTFATRLLDSNVDIVTVKKMMGHANIATTALYDRRGDEHMRQVAQQVAL